MRLADPLSDPEIVRRLDYAIVLLAVIAAAAVLRSMLPMGAPGMSVVFGLLVVAVGVAAYLVVSPGDRSGQSLER